MHTSHKKIAMGLVVACLSVVTVLSSVAALFPAQAQAAPAASAEVLDPNRLRYDDGGGLVVYTKDKGANGATAHFKEGSPKYCGNDNQWGPGSMKASEVYQRIDKNDWVIRDIDFNAKKANYIVYQNRFYAFGDRYTQEEFNKKFAGNDRMPGDSTIKFECEEVNKVAITLAAPQSNIGDAEYRWVDSGQIETLNGDKVYTKDATTNNDYFWQKDTNSCKEYISIVPGQTKGSLHHNGRTKPDGSCVYDLRDITVANPDGNANKAAGSGLLTSSNQAPTGSTTHIDCETGFGGGFSIGSLIDGSISWIVCPLIDGAQAIVNGVGNAVVDQLIIKPEVLECAPNQNKADCPATAVRAAWNDFRIIALSLLLLVALVGAAAGSFIDAYTLKKVLPRMLISIIAISLSWDLMKLALAVTNAVGTGVAALIETPFKSLPNAALDPWAVVTGVGGGGFFMGILGMLSFVGTAALAVIIAFIVVAIRYVAIIAFIIAAPFAIMCSILPGTQKVWNVWREGLQGALIMLPIITGMLALGASLGKVVALLQGGPFGQLMALIVTYGPYFVIPKAFSMAGGLVATLSGMANDRNRGLFDRLKKFRQDQGQRRRHDIMAGKAFKPGNEESRFGRFKNKASDKIQTGLLLPQMGIGTRGNRLSTMKGNLQNAKELAEWEHSTEMLKNNAFARKYAQDDDFGHGLLEGDGDYAKTRAAIAENGGARFDGPQGQRDLDNLTAAALRVRREAGVGAAGLVAIRGLGTSSTAWKTKFKKDAAGNDIIDQVNGDERYGYRILDGEESNIKMQRSIDKALGHGRGNLANVIAEVRSGQDAAGRPDNGSSSFSDTLYANKLLHEMGPRPTAPPAGASAVEIQNYQTQVAAYDEKVNEISRSLYLSTLEGKPAGAVIGGKEQAAENLTRAMVEDTEGIIKGSRKGKWGQAAINQPTVGSEQHEEAVIQALAYEEGSRVAATQYSKAGGAAISKGLTRKIDLTSLPANIREALTLKGYRPETERKTQVNSAGEAETIEVPTGRTVPIYEEGDTITHAQAIDNLQRTNKKMAASVKIYVEQATAAAAQQQAAQAAAQAGQAQANAQGQNRDFIPPTGPTFGGPTLGGGPFGR